MRRPMLIYTIVVAFLSASCAEIIQLDQFKKREKGSAGASGAGDGGTSVPRRKLTRFENDDQLTASPDAGTDAGLSE